MLLAFLFVAGMARAQDGIDGQPSPPAVAGEDPMQQIPATLEALEAAKAGEYGRLRGENKRRIEAADREIQALRQGGRDLHTLDGQERIRLFNAQEAILVIVGDLKRSELVCTYRQNIGTRFRTKHCVTRQMAEAQQRAAGEMTRNAQKRECVPGEGKPC